MHAHALREKRSPAESDCFNATDFCTGWTGKLSTAGRRVPWTLGLASGVLESLSVEEREREFKIHVVACRRFLVRSIRTVEAALSGGSGNVGEAVRGTGCLFVWPFWIAQSAMRCGTTF